MTEVSESIKSFVWSRKSWLTFAVKPPFSGVFMILLSVLTNRGSDYNQRQNQAVRHDTKKREKND